MLAIVRYVIILMIMSLILLNINNKLGKFKSNYINFKKFGQTNNGQKYFGHFFTFSV